MSRFTRPAVGGLIVLALAANSVQAQFVVHDPVNYTQALLRYAQLLEQYRFWIRQARRLPIDMVERYRVPETRWRHHDAEGEYPFARPLLSALNFGDTGGAGYRQTTDRLDSLDEILSTVPTDLQRRLESPPHGSIEFADSVARMGIHQVGAIRGNGKNTLAAIERMESDSAVLNEAYNSQAALLNKINAAERARPAHQRNHKPVPDAHARTADRSEQTHPRRRGAGDGRPPVPVALRLHLRSRPILEDRRKAGCMASALTPSNVGMKHAAAAAKSCFYALLLSVVSRSSVQSGSSAPV